MANGCVKTSRFGSYQGEYQVFCRFVCCRSCQPEEILPQNTETLARLRNQDWIVLWGSYMKIIYFLSVTGSQITVS